MSEEGKKAAGADETVDETVDVTVDMTVDMTEDVTEDADLAVESMPPASPSEPQPEPEPEPEARPVANSAAPRIRRAAPERLVTAYEFKELRKLNADPQMRRRVIRWSVVGVLLSIALCYFYYRSTLTEKIYTWPGAIENQFNDGEVVLRYRDRNAFKIYFPNAEGMTVEQDAEKMSATINTRIGAYYECPLKITFESYSDTNWWQKTLQQVADEWKQKAAEKGISFEDLDERIRFFNPHRSAGWPSIEGFMTWNRGYYIEVGKWTLFRDLDRVFVMTRTVIGIHWHGAHDLLEGERLLQVSGSLTDGHFEVPETLRTEKSPWLIRYVRNEMARDFANADWADLENAIKTLLVRGYRTGDAALTEDAVRLWTAYRNEQQLWYNRRCFAYRCAVREYDEDSLRMIRKESLKKFSSWDDMRRKRILRGDWGM